MTRVTVGDVRALRDTDAEDIQIENAIAMAGEVMTDLEAVTSYNDAKYRLIEQNLAAHFTTIFDPVAESVTLADTKVSYKTLTGDGFKATRWGEAATILDSDGKLVELEKDRSTQSGMFETFGHDADDW